MDSVTIREANFDDQPAVQSLCQRNGLEGERSIHAWNWIWKENRFYTSSWTIGWVLESSGTVVGFIGNIPRAYSFRGKQWIASVARAFVVDAPFRMHTLKLIAAFFQQKETDLFIFSSANSEAESIYSLARAKRIPQLDYPKDLFWVVSPHSFTTSLLKKKGVGRLLSVLASCLISPFLYLEMLIRRRWVNYSTSEVKMVQPTELTDEMDELWNKLQIENPDRLLSYRDREAIVWQFSNDSAGTRKPVIFALRRKKVLTGYIIVTRADSSEYDLKRMMITDLIVREDNPEAIKELINAAFFYAKQNKMDLLQMTGFPSTVRSALQSLHPFIHTLPYHPFWYYAVNPDLKDQLQNESVWYASTFDGDSTL
jgi:hypothetical protein